MNKQDYEQQIAEMRKHVEVLQKANIVQIRPKNGCLSIQLCKNMKKKFAT